MLHIFWPPPSTPHTVPWGRYLRLYPPLLFPVQLPSIFSDKPLVFFPFSHRGRLRNIKYNQYDVDCLRSINFQHWNGPKIKSRSAKIDFCVPCAMHFIDGVIFVKLSFSLSILLIWAYYTCLNQKDPKNDEQVQLFNLIGDMAYQKTNLVFSPFWALKRHFKQKNGSKFRKIKKITSIYFIYTCCDQIWTQHVFLKCLKVLFWKFQNVDPILAWKRRFKAQNGENTKFVFWYAMSPIKSNNSTCSSFFGSF